MVIHMGESPQETDQLALLHALQPDRIGHGVFLSPDAEDWILSHRIPIEVCLTSGTLVGFIDHPSKHPGLRYFAQGHPIMFCTDDPLLFSTFLSQELLIAYTQAGLSLDEIERIVQQSFDYASNHD
jgi:adenosine deaminase